MGTMIKDCFFTLARNRTLPDPPPRAVTLMLDELEERLAALEVRPVALACRSWMVPSQDARTRRGNCLARMTIAHERGAMLSRLATWYQWQHPVWHWATEPLPDIALRAIHSTTRLEDHR